MPNYADKAERTREFYRKQGSRRTVDRIIEDLQTDAVVSITFTTDQVAKIVEIVESTLQERQVVPNE